MGASRRGKSVSTINRPGQKGPKVTASDKNLLVKIAAAYVMGV